MTPGQKYSIRLCNKKIIYKNKQHENKYNKPHTYRIRDKLLVRKKISKKYEERYIGPYPITQVWTNGNVKIRRGAVQERINIRYINTYN